MTGVSRYALPALIVGAVGIAFSPIFVRLSEPGPTATAFHRAFLSLPLLWGWVWVFDPLPSRP
ncbi:MAG: EamA/RhaT family transporter, partial [Alphaproteobacteria bacterium]|nr:EamA/RhaT family transporter [Alphaproteobacteria bacterium]